MSNDNPVCETPHSQVDKLPLYSVVLHKDDKISQDYIQECVHKFIPSLSMSVIQEKVQLSQNEGRSILLMCHQERAELLESQFSSSKIIVTIEKV